MAIGTREGWECPRLTRSTGRVLLACEQKSTLHLKQASFDRTGPTKSPQQACQAVSERKLQHGSWINAADKGTLERSVGPNIFESMNDGLVGEPITPSAVT